VRGAIDGVVREALIAAGLTGLMMLLFLGSWRSTLIVLVSIRCRCSSRSSFSAGSGRP